MAFDGPLRTVPMTLYTEQLIVRGAVETREHRVTDILNEADRPFLVLDEVLLEEIASNDGATRADYAQVNLASILFAVSLQAIEPIRALRTPKTSERAFVSIPPFRVIGNVHLLPERSLRDLVGGPRSPFLPVTDAVFWSDRLGGGRQYAAMVAVNIARAQILAPYRDAGPGVDVDAGTERRAPGTTVAPTRLPGVPDDPGPRPPGAF